MRRIYALLLRVEGYTVYEAANIVNAREIIKSDNINLVLLDIKFRIGEPDGRELYEILQSFHKTLKIIVTSVYPLEEQKQIIKDAFDYYDKAQGIEVLLDKVKNAMQEN